MDRSGIVKLLKAVSVNYPTFRRHIEADGGGISQAVIDEWDRQIGFLDYDEAMYRLDQHMGGENGMKIPKPADLKRFRSSNAKEEWHEPIRHQWHLGYMRWDKQRMHGRLFDEEGREYVHDPRYEDGYHYDRDGRICTNDGKVVFV